MNVLHIVDSISDSDGVSSHVIQLMKSIDEAKAKQYLLCGKIISSQKFRTDGITIMEHVEFLHSGRSIGNFAAAIKTLYALCKQLDADVIHSHSHFAANIAWYVSKLTGIRTVQTIHGIIPESGRLGHFKAGKFICVSEPGAEYLTKVQKIPENMISIIRQGIKHSGLQAENRFSRHEVHVVSASRLVHEKGPDVFIRAAGLVQSVCNNVRFSLAGTGTMVEELKTLNEKCGGKVNFLGEVKDIFSFLKDADIFVMSGRTKDEGFPMSVAEAGLAGCLVISSRFDALKYVFDETKDGVTFELEDHEELAEQIIKAVNNRQISVSMALEFQKKANELFDVKSFASKHMKVYNG